MAFRQKIVIAPGWHELLRKSGLDQVDALYAPLKGGVVLKSGRATEVQRVQLADGTAMRTLYIKKYWYPTTSLRWSGFYRGTYLGASKVRREFENLVRLRGWGLDAPTPVAFGEERKGRWLHRSFLISEGVTEPLPLDLFVAQHLPGLGANERKRLQKEMIERLADYTRRMHEHSFVHHDYYWRNILLSGALLNHFFLIDSHKGCCWKPWAETQSRAKDLATLDAPASGFFRRTERLRFFLRYRGHLGLTKEDKALIRLVIRLAEPMRATQLRRIRAAQVPGKLERT